MNKAPNDAVLEGRQLLLVDDDEAYGRSLRTVLAAQGLGVRWLRSCAETLSAIRALSVPAIDFALIDDLLHDGFGLDLLPLLDALEPAPAIALLTASVSNDRAVAALRLGHVLLPKPSGVAETLDLLRLLGRRGTPHLAARARKQAPTGVGGETFWLQPDGLRTPSGFVSLRQSSLAILRVLFARRTNDAFVPAEELARILNRRDAAGPAMVRQRIAGIRAALGPHAWLIESSPKRGYRFAQLRQ